MNTIYRADFKIISSIYFFKEVAAMDTIVVLKFGGSSVSDNNKLKIVADKIINEYKKIIKLLLFYQHKEKQLTD